MADSLWRRIAKVLFSTVGEERLRAALHGIADAIVDAIVQAAQDPVRRVPPRKEEAKPLAGAVEQRTAEDAHPEMDDPEPTADLPVRRLGFGAHTVTAVKFRGRWLWRCAEVGSAIGYGQGSRFADSIRGEWAADLHEGADFEVLRGDALREFKQVCADAVPGGVDRSPALLVLTASGIERALILSRTEKGERLRDLLVGRKLL